MNLSNGKDRMLPISGENVDVDGIYKNDWGREEELMRGQVFPADPQLGTTAWELVRFTYDNHHMGETDIRLRHEKAEGQAGGGGESPRKHIDRGDK